MGEGFPSLCTTRLIAVVSLTVFSKQNTPNGLLLGNLFDFSPPFTLPDF